MNSRLGKVLSRGYVLGAITLLAALAVSILVGARSIRFTPGQQAINSVPSGLRSTPDTAKIRETYNHLPLIFEQNNGQSDPQVKFLTHGSGYGLFLTGKNAVLSLHHRIDKSTVSASALTMTLAGANPRFSVTGENLLPGKSNYFIGNDPSKWQHDVPQFAGVRYRGVYPGIDLVYHGNQGRIEYDFEIAPGAEPSHVAMKFEGAENALISNTGDLILSLPGGDVAMHAPRAYQKSGANEQPVASRFVLNDGTVGFVVGNYDRSRTLVIDPILSYSTYLGGSGNEACTLILNVTDPISGCPAVAVDPASNAYIAGSTDSNNFPIPVGSSPFQGTLNPAAGAANFFVAKFNSTATVEEFATYIGGNGVDTTSGIAVDQAFNVIVSGNSSSSDFPTSTTAFQPTPLNTTNKHTVVSKLDPTGHTLLYSTYLSGTGTDTSTGVALDPSGNIYVTGTTTSKEVTTGFPSTVGAFQTAPATSSAIQFFMTKIAPNLSGTSSVPYSTYFGGGNSGNAGPAAVGGGIAVDLNSNVYITGGTSFLHIGAANDFPILNAYQGCLDTAPSTTTCPNNVTNYDIFVAKINPAAVTGTQLIYSTYVGGTLDDIGYGIAVDSSLNAYVTGSTDSSTGFPITGTDVFQSTYGGDPSDAFLVKLANPVNTGTLQGLVTLAYSSYLGGAGQDVGLGIVVDTIQGARITGWTGSNNFPVPNDPVQGALAGMNDAFVVRIDTSTNLGIGAPGNYGTYLGGSGQDYGTSIAVDPLGASYVAGETQSPPSGGGTPFPTTAGAFQPLLSGNSDAFLSKLSPVINLGVQVTPSPFTVGVGSQATFSYTITNTGDSTSGITFTDFLPSTGASFVSATSSPGTCGAASGGEVLCNIGTMNSQATATVTVILVPTAGTSPATGSVALTNSGSAAAQGFISPTAVGTVTVNDYTLTVSPSNATVPAGVPANLTATLTPTGPIPDSVSISCSGLPTGASCTETTNPIPNLNQGPASTALVISTTMRVTTVTQLLRRGEFYAVLLPLSGLTLLGVGIGGSSRKRRALMTLLIACFFSLIFFQAGCGSKSTTTTTGTPAGTYIVTVTATSGQATRTVPVTLVVQ